MLVKVFNKSNSKTQKGGIVGFLKFLKKSKKDKLEMPFEGDLDMPPPPPIGIKDELPPMPKFNEKPFSMPEEKIKTLPDLEQIEPETHMGALPKPPEIPELGGKVKPHTIEELPELPEIPVERPQEPMIHKFKPPKSMPLMHKIRQVSPLEKMEKAAVRAGKEVLKHEPAPLKPIFLRVETFKDIRKDISVIRNGLKNNDEVLTKLGNTKNAKDNEFNKWQKTMEDVQKKMMFIDKNLFKGD
jgi:hypothetical protein|tara:strand:+ start:816 stop:1541 length:726 start_codon:yes stop_codon:yes gene_type:complete